MFTTIRYLQQKWGSPIDPSPSSSSSSSSTTTTTTTPINMTSCTSIIITIIVTIVIITTSPQTGKRARSPAFLEIECDTQLQEGAGSVRFVRSRA